MHSMFRRLLSTSILALLCLSKASAQVVVTIDWSNLSAVKFTATGNAAAGNFNTLTFQDGIALLGFLSAPANVQDLDGGVPTGTSTLTDSNNILTSTSTFNRLSSWNDSQPSFYPNNGNGSDLTLWNDSAATGLSFSNSSPAFNGEATFDLSAYSGFTNLFPALNATGNVGIWNGNGTLGTWQVVGAAVPEPSTYAALVGLGALALTMLRRRTA